MYQLPESPGVPHYWVSILASLTASAHALRASSNFFLYSSGVATYGVAPCEIRNS